MNNKIKDISTKNCTYEIFNDIINTKNFDPNNIKIDKKPYKNTLIYYIGHLRITDSKYIIIDDDDDLYLIINKKNGYFVFG